MPQYPRVLCVPTEPDRQNDETKRLKSIPLPLEQSGGDAVPGLRCNRSGAPIPPGLEANMVFH
ncbi:hypothetical protein IFHNHDMJ_00360 [Synechococcus sp. CBW1107]|nr:hypothetical protein IFHNHDMJ_00360 [Synechococcus sp. CBW1107]